ncbi:phosphotransferase [Streptomyces buecherae]|uniref:Phosphotransferase n=1 Tax=Streptomyces buecherae TaxID=2763006 RepID=A0A7H8NAD7_9ACTN|nr:phosphotransferase [Streptomyces buecherae]QKW51332.1 phosphotransferase [Streptomyces buecherae]
MTERVRWADLPAVLKRAIEARTGRITRTEEVPEGLNSSLALVLDTQHGESVFLKGVRTSSHADRAGLLQEQQVNALVSELGVGPGIRHSFECEGWHCLAFAYVSGAHANLGPASRDLPAVASTLQRVQEAPPPRLPLPRFAERFAAHLRPGEAEALGGPYLLHTDTNPHNLMIEATSGVAYIVDWAMPALGPAWIDVAYTAVRLMECGHTPEAARAWLAGFAAWRTAEPAAVETFVNVVCRHWIATVGERDAEPSNARFRSLLV